MPAMFVTNFAALDWVIVGAYLMVSVVIGIVVNKYIHNVGDYMVGGRASGTSLNVATYIGTGLGLVTLMYASIDAFQHGFAYMTLALIGAATGIFLGSTGFVICRLRRLELTTLPEYFERRFDKRTRVTAGTICAIAGILNMGLFPKMGATFITYATGIGGANAETTVNLITTALIVLVLIYTVLGGMVSVIVTDYIQFVVLSVGLAIGVYFCLTHPNLGWQNMTAALVEHRGERAFNPIANPAYGWIWIAFNLLLFFFAFLCWAPEASRTLTSKDERTTRRTFLFAGPGQFIRLAIPAFFAIAAFCWFTQDAELSAHFFPDGPSGDIQNAAQAMPLILGKVVPTGVLGMLVAGLMAAFMSTHDSYLLAWASVITRDVITPMRGAPTSDRHQIAITRVLVVLIGVFLLVWGIWYPLPDSVWSYMAVTGTIYISGAGVALIGGMYWKRASRAGAMASLLGGLVSVAALAESWLQANIAPWLTGITLGFFNYLFCAILFVVFSLLLPDPPKEAGA
jgi:SSS family solute:Na+ symporter